MTSRPSRGRSAKPVRAALGVACGAVLVAVAATGGCSAGSPPDLGGQNGPETGVPPAACSRGVPEPGCACTQTGAVGECGKVIQHNGDYVTCSMGHTTCNGATWSACAGDRMVMKERRRHHDRLRRPAGLVDAGQLHEPVRSERLHLDAGRLGRHR